MGASWPQTNADRLLFTNRDPRALLDNTVTLRVQGERSVVAVAVLFLLAGPRDDPCTSGLGGGLDSSS